jgi:hypothetical protein
MCGYYNLSAFVCLLAAAEVEKSGYERHKAEKRQQAAQVLGQQKPARVGEGKFSFSSHKIL